MGCSDNRRTLASGGVSRKLLGVITLTGDPKSTQHIYRTGVRFGHASTYMTPEGKGIKEGYQWEAKSQWKHNIYIGPVELHINFFFGSKRKRDLDNQNKLVLDALTGIVYEDDAQIDELHLYRRYDKDAPHIMVDVYAM